MANYLTMSFDPALPNLLQYHKTTKPDFLNTLDALETELEGLLQDNDVDVIGLMELIAVR